MRGTVAGAVLLSLALSAGAAWGQTGPEAEYARAGQLRREEHLDEALAIYQRLSDETHEGRALGERGITEAQMGRWVISEEHLVAALATDDRWVRHHRSTLQAALEAVRGHVSDLTVMCNVPGATLRVNGLPSGTLPRATPLRVANGPVVLEVAADLHDPHRQTVQVVPGSNRVEVTLVAEAVVAPRRAVVAPDPVSPVATPVVVPARPVVAPERAAAMVAPTLAETSGRPLPALRITAFSLAAVGVGLGVAGLVLRNGAADSFTGAGTENNRCGVSGDAVSGPSECQGYYDTVQSMQTMEIAGFVGGGVFAAAGVVLLLVSPSSSTARATAWGCGQGPGSVGVSCGGRF